MPDIDISPYLEDLERRIDPEAESDLMRRWQEFADGRFDGQVFTPMRPHRSPPGIEWPEVSTNAAIEDHETMALQQFGYCSQTLVGGGGGLLCVRCNYGTGILPSLFGAELFMMPEETNTLPTVRPVAEGPEDLRRLVERGVPDIHQALGGRTFRMGERFLEIKAAYPRIGEHVHLYHPDLQGPMDVVELLRGSGLFLDAVDRPELIKDLLEVVTEAYIRFMRAWDELVPSPDGYCVQWSLLHRGSIMLRDDSAMNFSPKMFDDLIRPYDERLLAEFGGGGLHFCGKGDHYIASASEMPGLRAVNLSQPEYNDMEQIFRHTVDRGIQVVGLPAAGAEEAVARGRDLHGNVHCAEAVGQPTATA